MKTLFFLLITLFFATIGFAEVSQQSDETNKKIEKIEEKLDTTKEELTKYTQITEDTKERVGDINGSVDRLTLVLSVSVGFFGILITGIVIFFSFRSIREAKLEAKEEARATAKKEAQELLDKWIMEKEKVFSEKEKHFEKIMNDKITLFEDNVDVKTIQIMYENAVGYGRDKKYSEALKIYDEIISNYANSQNETIVIKVAMSIMNKGVNFSFQEEYDKAISAYNDLISIFEDTEIDVIRTRVKMAVKNRLELEIMIDKSISKIDNIIEKMNEQPKDIAVTDMLLIIQNAKTSLQNSEIQSWLQKYKDIKYPEWRFNEFEAWIEKANYGEDVKARIRSYIETFKAHLHRA